MCFDRRYRPVLLVLVAILTVATTTFAQDKPIEQITLMAYNVENMFDVFDDPYTEDERTDVKTRDEIRQIAAAIADQNPDVVVFSELENEYLLRAMVEEFLPEAGYDQIATMKTNSGRGINLGVISRVPIRAMTSHRLRTLTLPDEPKTWHFARDLFRVTLDIGSGQKLDVFAVHFKSKRDSPGDPDSNKWRLAEATAAKSIIGGLLKQDPSRLIAMAGDFNDTADSAVMKLLTDQAKLVDVHAAVPSEKKITYLREPYRSQIDFILASPALAKCLVEGSTVVPDDTKLLAGSDHAPVVARFDLTRLER